MPNTGGQRAPFGKGMPARAAIVHNRGAGAGAPGGGHAQGATAA